MNTKKQNRFWCNRLTIQIICSGLLLAIIAFPVWAKPKKKMNMETDVHTRRTRIGDSADWSHATSMKINLTLTIPSKPKTNQLFSQDSKLYFLDRVTETDESGQVTAMLRSYKKLQHLLSWENGKSPSYENATVLWKRKKNDAPWQHSPATDPETGETSNVTEDDKIFLDAEREDDILSLKMHNAMQDNIPKKSITKGNPWKANPKSIPDEYLARRVLARPMEDFQVEIKSWELDRKKSTWQMRLMDMNTHQHTIEGQGSIVGFFACQLTEYDFLLHLTINFKVQETYDNDTRLVTQRSFESTIQFHNNEIIKVTGDGFLKYADTAEYQLHVEKTK